MKASSSIPYSICICTYLSVRVTSGELDGVEVSGAEPESVAYGAARSWPAVEAYALLRLQMYDCEHK